MDTPNTITQTTTQTTTGTKVALGIALGASVAFAAMSLNDFFEEKSVDTYTQGAYDETKYDDARGGGEVDGPETWRYCREKCNQAWGMCLDREAEGSDGEACHARARQCYDLCNVLPDAPPGYLPPGYVPPGYVPSGYTPPGYFPSGYKAPGYIPAGYIPHGTPLEDLPPGYKWPGGLRLESQTKPVIK